MGEKKEEMAQPYVYAHPPGTAPRPPGAFVNPRFCVAGPVDLTMVRDEIEKKWGSFVILDANMNLRFQVKKPGFGFGFGKNMILLDGSGSPILTMKEQVHRHIKKKHTLTHTQLKSSYVLCIVGLN